MARRVTTFFATAVWLAAAAAASAGGLRFSIDAPSPNTPLTVPAPGNSFQLLPVGPPGGPPTVDAAGCDGTGGFMGLLGVPIDDLDALTCSGPISSWIVFSVDRFSVGLAGAVPPEAAAGQQAGDLYLSMGAGTNALFRNQHLLAEFPPVPAGVPVPPPIDNLDAVDLDGTGPVFFSLDPAGAAFYGVFPADILGPGPVPVVPFPALGLVPADDIDALHFDGGVFFFSLAPGSPSLVPGPVGCGCPGASPADVFSSPAAGFSLIFAPAPALGLLPTDNLDALDFETAGPAVPGLGTFGMVVLAGLIVSSAGWLFRQGGPLATRG